MLMDGADMWDVAQIGVTLLVVLVIMPIRNEIKRLTESDEKLRDEIRAETASIASRVTSLEVDVARNYIQRHEVIQSFADINQKLDKIALRIDERLHDLDQSKADK